MTLKATVVAALFGTGSAFLSGSASGGAISSSGMNAVAKYFCEIKSVQEKSDALNGQNVIFAYSISRETWALQLEPAPVNELIFGTSSLSADQKMEVLAFDVLSQNALSGPIRWTVRLPRSFSDSGDGTPRVQGTLETKTAHLASQKYELSCYGEWGYLP